MICTPDLGLIGDSCMVDGDCLSGLCVDQGTEGRVCTRECSPDVPCGAGFGCERVGDGSEAVCVRPLDEVVPKSEGGCSVGVSRPSGWTSVMGLALLGLVWTRRRRRTR